MAEDGTPNESKTEALAFRAPEVRAFAWEVSLTLLFMWLTLYVFLPKIATAILPALALGIGADFIMQHVIRRRQRSASPPF